MTRSELARILDAHHRVWDGWWRPLLALPGSDAHRDIGGSFPSVFTTTRHLVDAEGYWQHHLDGGPFDAAAMRATTMEELEGIWKDVRERRQGWLAGADPEARVTFRASGGYLATVAAWECVIHVISHAHFHRGQLVIQFRALGAVPPSLHLLGPFFGEF